MATRFTRQPAHEAARLILQHSHSGCRSGYLPESGQLTSQVVMLHRTQRLGEDICQLLVGIYIGELDLLCFYFLCNVPSAAGEPLAPEPAAGLLLVGEK